MKKIAAVLISLCMVIAIMPASTAFGEVKEDEQGKEKKVCKLFTVGDSTTTGYGVPDSVFDNKSYAIGNNDLDTWTYDAASKWNEVHPDQKRGRMSNHTFSWQLKKYIESSDEYSGCDLTSLCIDGMMATEFRAMLDSDYYEKAKAEEDEVYGDRKGMINMLTPQYIEFLYNGGATNEKSYEAIHEYTVESVKDADVVVMDVCMNNFALYVVRRIASITGSDAYNSENYAKVNVEDIEELSDRTRSTLKVLREELGGMLGDNPIMKGIVDMMLFTYAHCATNLSEDVKIVRQLNPDAKIIVCGLYNPSRGYTIKVDGKEVDLGKLYDVMIRAMDTYIRALDVNSPNYYYADVPDDLTRMEELCQASESYDDLVSTPGGAAAMENIYKLYGAAFFPSPEVAEQFKDKIKRLFYESTRYFVVDQSQLAGDGVSPEQMGKEIGAYLKDGTIPSEATMVSLHLMANMILQHPSEAGCDQKARAVIDAYDKDHTAYEEVLGDVVDAVKAAASKAGISSIDDLKKIAALKDLTSLISKEELLKIAQSIYDLPDLEAQIQQYMDEHSGEDAGKTEDRIASLEAQINDLTAIIEKLTQEAEKKKSTLAKAKIKTVKPAKKALTVKWKAVANASGYQVYYKASGKKAVIKTVKGAKKLTLKLTGLKKKAKYTVKVRAYKTASGKTTYGKWSAAKKAKTK